MDETQRGVVIARGISLTLGIGLFVVIGVVHHFESSAEVALRVEKPVEVSAAPTQRAAERTAEEVREREQKEAEDRVLAEAQAQEARRCAKDLSCIAEKMVGAAEDQCSPAIESLAKYDFQWTANGGPFDRRLHRILLTSKLPVITYLGERIKFQNGFGAWVIGSYECDFNVESGRALAVRGQVGRVGLGERVTADRNRGSSGPTVLRGGY